MFDLAATNYNPDANRNSYDCTYEPVSYTGPSYGGGGGYSGGDVGWPRLLTQMVEWVLDVSFYVRRRNFCLCFDAYCM